MTGKILFQDGKFRLVDPGGVKPFWEINSGKDALGKDRWTSVARGMDKLAIGEILTDAIIGGVLVAAPSHGHAEIKT